MVLIAEFHCTVWWRLLKHSDKYNFFITQLLGSEAEFYCIQKICRLNRGSKYNFDQKKKKKKMSPSIDILLLKSIHFWDLSLNRGA